MTKRRAAMGVVAACLACAATLLAGAAHAAPIQRHIRASRVRHASLPSRGTQLTTAVVGRLGVVTASSTKITGGRARYDRVLAICQNGQYLGLCGQTDTQYAVLMIDHSIGFVNKADVELLDNVVTAQSGASGGPLAQQLVQTALQYRGVPYVWGGNTSSGIDCSGFVKAVFAASGIDLPRHSGDQAAVGYDVSKDDVNSWMPGDRMYFACHHPEIDHTGMYIGGGYFIHSSVGNSGVAIDKVDNAYYYEHLICVRRSTELVNDAAASQDAEASQAAHAQPAQTASTTPGFTATKSPGGAKIYQYNGGPTAVASDPESSQQ